MICGVGVCLYRMWDLVMVWSSLQPKVPNCAQREGLWPWSVVRPRTGLSWSSQHLQLAGITPDQSGRTVSGQLSGLEQWRTKTNIELSCVVA